MCILVKLSESLASMTKRAGKDNMEARKGKTELNKKRERSCSNDSTDTRNHYRKPPLCEAVAVETL